MTKEKITAFFSCSFHKEDADIIDYFKTIATQCGIVPILADKPEARPVIEKVKETICDQDAFVAILTDKARGDQHASAWVHNEIGIGIAKANDFDKPIVVFKEDTINKDDLGIVSHTAEYVSFSRKNLHLSLDNAYTLFTNLHSKIRGRLLYFPSGRITIVLPSMPRLRPPSVKANNYPCFDYEAAFDDVKTALELIPALVELNQADSIETTFDKDLPTVALEHRICIGSPATNDLTGAALSGAYYQFGAEDEKKQILYGKKRGECYETQIKNNVLVEDYGLISRWIDENGHVHLVVAGCRAYGQLALAKVLKKGGLLVEEANKLAPNENFQLVVAAEVVGKTIVNYRTEDFRHGLDARR